MRIISVVTTARATIRMSRSYGNPDTVYSFPSTAIPAPRSARKRGGHARRRRSVGRALWHPEPPSTYRLSLLREFAARAEILHMYLRTAKPCTTLTHTTTITVTGLNQLLARHGWPMVKSCGRRGSSYPVTRTVGCIIPKVTFYCSS